MQDEVIYRCIHAACARQLPRRVNFCPYCGTGQHAGVDKPSHALPKVEPVTRVAPPAPAPAAPAAAVKVAPLPAAPVVPPPAAKARPAVPPPEREPVRMRTWVLVVLLLWGIWYTAKPSASKQIDARIDQAIALSRECKSGQAQAELIALRSTKATPEQLARLQQAINAEASSCDRKRREGSPRADRQSARNLVADAQRAMEQGDYRGAIDKMEVCIAMVDSGSRECGPLKARAERKEREMLACTRDGGDWVDGKCS